MGGGGVGGWGGGLGCLLDQSLKGLVKHANNLLPLYFIPFFKPTSALEMCKMDIYCIFLRIICLSYSDIVDQLLIILYNTFNSSNQHLSNNNNKKWYESMGAPIGTLWTSY